MQPVIFALDARLGEAGDTLPLKGHLDETSYSLGEREFSLPSGIDYDLVLTNAGEGILATGILTTHVVGTCDRCLSPAEFDVSGEVDEYYLFEEPEAHLHPQMQVNIADFVANAVSHGMHLQITTHSDYFLRRLNDRIFLQKIQSLDAKRYVDTLSKYGYTDLTLDSSQIGAYLLRREEDGSVKVVPQELDKGIPYESFYNVIKKEISHSLDIQQTYINLKQEDHAE